MTNLVPVRATEAVRVTRPDGEVVETVRTVEFATLPPASPGGWERRELPGGTAADVCDCALCSSVLHLDSTGPPRRALPPGSPAPARGWRPGWWPW